MKHNHNGLGGIARNRNTDNVRENLREIATGIFLNIDNNMLSACQKALDTAMIKVCGSTESCDDMIVDENAGTRSFKYEVCQYKPKTTLNSSDNVLGGGLSGRRGSVSGNNDASSTELEQTVCRTSLESFSKEELKDSTKPLIGKLTGVIYWEYIDYTENDNGITFTDADEYIAKLDEKLALQGKELTDEDKRIIREQAFNTEVDSLKNAVQNAITTIEADQTVQYCMNGRKFQGYDKILGTVDENNTLNPNKARFPNLTKQIRRMIADSAIRSVRDNYMQKYDEEMERMMKDQVKAARTIDEENAKTKAMNMCIAYGQSGAMPVTYTPKTNTIGNKWLIWGGIALAPFTGGISLAASAVGAISLMTEHNMDIDKLEATNTHDVIDGNIGYSVSETWNYKQTIKTIPDYESGVCTVIKTTTKCAKAKQNICTKWEDEVEEKTTINLLN